MKEQLKNTIIYLDLFETGKATKFTEKRTRMRTCLQLKRRQPSNEICI